MAEERLLFQLQATIGNGGYAVLALATGPVPHHELPSCVQHGLISAATYQVDRKPA